MDQTINCTPPEMRKEAEEVVQDLLPSKSKDLYLKAYDHFKRWCSSKNTGNTSENIMLAYLSCYGSNKKASSLWAHYSMLKSTIVLKENIDISKYYKLIEYLKDKNETYVPKKSKVFTREQISEFLRQASDDIYISLKAVLIVGVAGACRCDELCKLLVTDVINEGDISVINIRTSKNGTARKFVILEPTWICTLKKYLKMRPIPDIPRLFISIRNGKPTRQNIAQV